ncbi:protein TASOR 2 isoform X2 [Rhinolophus ferrumequinum]|uniref:Transcription activation suppressor family member 2 n=1 Tax=Rhinolophus ferrumequinum TaxID=59479 RepID=A0A671FJY4_RHIFE|nr:protein TASOR 2 isoform X2 [Rhinolophus ferrumequinum]
MRKKLNNPKFSAAATAQKTVFETVSLSSESLFQRAVSILHTSYLDSASEHGFQYSQVTLVKNDIFLNEYKTFYQEKKASNYTQEELQETYGFLLFETEKQAKLACQRGLCIGSSAITTLGDPAKGVYISRYSDCLHTRPWYHGKSGYIVIFNLIKGKIKFVSENYTTNYTSPSSGYDCHVAANTNKVSHKTSHFRAFELSQYYLYELSGSTVTERPRQVHPYVIVAFQYREPKKMAAPAQKSILELSENVLISPWKGKLIIQGCLLCDITLWSSYSTVVPTQLPRELDFKYVMKVSSLKKSLPEAAFRKQNYLEQKVYCQDMCFSMYEVELSNKQGEKIDKLIEFIKNKQLAFIKCLEDRGVFLLLTSSALISETNFGDEQIGLHGLHLVRSSLSRGLKDLTVEDDISLKVIPILPALNCALLEAKKSFTEEGICPNTLVKRSFQELCKVDRSPSLTAASRGGMKETTFFGKLSSDFDLVPPAEKCPVQSLTQLKSYFSDPSGYILEVSTALDLLAEHPQSPCISDGICDAGFSLVMTPDPEFLDSEAEVRKETETEKNSEEMFKARKRTGIPLSPVSNVRIQPKRKASMPPVVPSKRVNLCRPFPKRTPGADKGSASQATLKLVKGQFPQKRKRGDLSVCVSLRSTDVDNRLKSRNGKNGAEVLTAQFVQTTKLDRKNQEAPISKDVPVATSAKRARKQKRSPVKTVPRAKPPVKKSPQKPRVHVVKGNKNPRIRKQPQSAQEETTSQLQSEIASDGQEDVLNINTVQPENITVAQKDPAENSIANCDSQALNLLADLALSAASSTAPSPEPRNLPHSSELPQNDILLSQEHSLSSASDHEYHRGVKRQKSELLPEPSSEKSNPTSDSVVSQEEESLVPGSEAPIQAQAALPEETLETGSASQSSFVAVEHSYALLLAEHSKKLLQQRGVPGPAFAKNGTKGPEAGTPVGKVMPFRHQQNTSPLQKLSEVPLLRRKSRLLSSSLRDAYCSHTVFSCDGSFKVTFKCETSYVFSLDSKYTNNPLEKTVLRALHGPWNTDLPDNLEEVKLLLHMWVALFYSNQSKVIRSSRKVVEHSNPAKYVSINSRIGSFEVSEIEESPSVERCTVGPLLETKEAPRGPSAEVSFPDTHSLLPFIKPQPARGLELWVQNEQKEIFAREGHPATPESQNFIYSYNNEIMEGKEQQSSDKLETSNLMLSSIGSTQTNGPSVPGEGKTFEPFDSTRMTSYDDTVTQTPFTTTCDGVSSQSGICQKSVYSTLESKVDIFHATVQGKTSSLQGLSQHNSPINKGGQPSLERKDDMGYVMINLEPVPLTFEKNACEPKQTEVVNRADKPTAFNVELIKQVSAGTSLRHPVSTFEKAQTQSLKDISSLAMSGQKGTKYLSASSVSGETLAKEMCLLQKEIPNPGLSSPSENSVAKEALPLVRSSNYSLPREEMKLPQEFFLQPKSLFSIPSEEIMEPSQAEEVPSSASATLEQNDSLNCILSRSNTSDHSLELKSDKSSLKSISRNFESFNSAFTKPTSRSINGEEISLELEDDADIDLTLTISPPTSPREEMPAGEIGQHQEAPLPNLALQDMDEDIIEPEEVTLIENREVNSAKYTSVLPTVSKKPLDNKERQGDNLQMVTLILPKETCALEIAEVNVTSDFPFGSLIEEVSPASSPDPQVPVEETQSCQSVSPCSLKLPDSQCEESKKFSQIESVDLAITEKENCFVGPTHPVGHDTLTRVQQMQLSAEMPLVLNNYPGRKDRHLTLPGKVSEETVPSENDESVSFSEKVPCCDTELNHPALTASYGADFKTSVEKLVIPGNLLQPISIENRNLDLKHLALETSEPPFSPRKIMENKSSADPLVSTTAPSGIVNMPLKQTSPKSIKKSLSSSELKTNESSYLQAQSLSSDSVGGAGVTEARTSSEVPKLVFSSGNGTVTHCTKPVNTERQFQTQEIPVVRMASLLNSETEAGLHEKTIDRGGFGSQSNSTSSPRGKQKSIPRLQDMLTCDTKDLLNGGLSPMYFHADSYQNTEVTNENTNKDPSAFFVAKSRVPLVYGVSEEQMGKKSTGQGLGAKKDSESLGGDMAISVNSDIRYEPLSGDSDQDYLGDCRNLKLDMEDSCTLRCSHTKKKEGATQDDYDSFLRLSNSDNEDWSYSNQVPGLETNTPSRNRSGGLKKEGKCLPRYIQIRDYHGLPWTYANFTVTKELKQTNQASHSLRKHPGYTAKCGLVSSWTDTWQVADNLTQNTLDLEYLRFDHKLKQIIKKGASQHSASSTVFLKESPLPLTKAAKSPVLRPTSRSRSPLVVTVMFSDAKQQSQHLTSHTPSNLESSSFWKERCDHSRNHLTNSERNQTAFHLNKLKYNSTLKESRSDISLILNEYAEFNKVMMNSNQVLFQDKGSDVASGEAVSQEMYSSSPRRSASYEDMITDLCASLHVKLKSVMKEACKSTFLFYLVETEDKSFFVRTKTLLRKGGHTEIEPEHFCQAFHRENDTLMVIIKNEDISSYLHQIPSLLKLKHFPSVLFAGVDSPEDVLNYTYQELFRTGGFVVSDDRILETLTLVQLKEIVKILEKLNGNGRWKWLLHYKENKKLKEDARVDSIAHKKNLILKSCQSANIIELLYYHQCDSRSSTKAEHFKCLLNLQMQHIHARFAVFLTEKPTLSREVFENSGILVTDVNNFIGNIQKVAAPFRSSYW